MNLQRGRGGERGVPLVRGAGGVHVSLTHLDCTTFLSIQQGEKQRELAHSVMPDCGHPENSCSALVHILKTVYLTNQFGKVMVQSINERRYLSQGV